MARGAGLLGCLVWVALLGAAAYVGFAFAEPHFQAWRFEEAMEGQAGSADVNSDAEIRAFLEEAAARLEIPLPRRDLRIRRGRGRIAISAAWSQEVVLPRFRRKLHFQRDVTAPLSLDTP